MSIYQKNRDGIVGGVFYFDHQVEGYRNTGSTRTADRDEAKIFEAKELKRFSEKVRWRKAIEDKAHAQMKQSSYDPIFTLAELLTFYILHMKLIGYKSVDRMAMEAKRIVDLIGGNMLLTRIDNGVIIQMIQKAKQMNRGKRRNDTDLIKNVSVNRVFLQRLQAMFNFAKANHKCVLPFEPDWKNYKLREDKIRTHYLSYAQSDALDVVLLKNFPDYYAIDKFARASALRLSNLVGLLWSEVDWDKRVINVTAKGNVPHAVPISREIEDILRPLIGHHDEYVFTVEAKLTRKVAGEQREAGERYPMGREMYKIVSRKAFRLAGIPQGYSIHCHRHTAATWHYARTQDLIAVMRLLGHSNIQMALRYTKLDLRVVRAGMDDVFSDRLKAKSLMEVLPETSLETSPDPQPTLD